VYAALRKTFDPENVAAVWSISTMWTGRPEQIPAAADADNLETQNKTTQEIETYYQTWRNPCGIFATKTMGLIRPWMI